MKEGVTQLTNFWLSHLPLDSGAYTDPYEAFLRGGEEYDVANGDLGWSGLEFQTDELATFAIC